jgi:hypothetical protein
MCMTIYAPGKRCCSDCRTLAPGNDRESRQRNRELNRQLGEGYEGLPDEDEFENSQQPLCGQCGERTAWAQCDGCYIELCSVCAYEQPDQMNYMCAECDAALPHDHYDDL